jgi:pyridoxal phosphate enzyme (YggS family)
MAMDQIQYNLKAIERRIENACRESGRQRDELILVAVSKTVPFERIVEASNAGLTAFGENKVQEASGKIPRFNELGRTATWHMIGHLQTNKAKQAVKLFDVIESIDSVRLAQTVDKEAKAENREIDVLMEINSSGESSKFGFMPDETLAAAEEITKLENIRLRGLMTVGPFTDDKSKIEQAFGITQEIFARLKNKFDESIDTLSMGMSDDLEYAIKHGSTELRIGTAIFGIRNYGLDSSPNSGGHKAI